MLILFEGQACSGVTTLIKEFIRKFPLAVYWPEPEMYSDEISKAAGRYAEIIDWITPTDDGRSRRRQSVLNEINSRFIVSDRFIDEDYIEYQNQIMSDFKIPPDLTVIVDVDPDIAWQRSMKDAMAYFEKLPPIKIHMATSPSSDVIVEYNRNVYEKARELTESRIIGEKYRSRFFNLPNVYPERQFIIVDGNDPIGSAEKIYQKIQSLQRSAW